MVASRVNDADTKSSLDCISKFVDSSESSYSAVAKIAV